MHLLGTRTILFCAAVLASVLTVGAQELDSLRQAWELRRSTAGAAPDSALVRLAIAISRGHQESGGLDSALHYSGQAISLAQLGADAALGIQRAEWLGLRMEAERAHAAQLFFLNRYPESIAAINAYLATAQELRLPEEIGAAYNYLGYCYTAMEDLHSALAWSRKAIVTLRDFGEGIDLANAYTGLGNILDEMGQHDSAFLYMRKAISLHRDLDRPNNLAGTYFSAIETLRHLGWSDSVDVYLARVALLVKQLDQPRSTMNYLNLLGQRVLEQGRPADAIALLLRADTLAVEIEDHRSRHYINRALALAYAAVGSTQEAVARAELADAELKEDMGLEKVRAVAAAQANAEREKELAMAAANAEALRRGRWFAWAVAGGGVAVSLLLGVLYTQGKRNAKRLAEAQAELMKLEKQRESERVRMSVSRDIHDELGGSLSKIALLSDLVQQDASAPESAGRLRSIADHARQVRGSLNDVVWAADPSSDTTHALLEHLADRAHRLLDGTGVELHLHLHADNPGQLLGPAFKRDLSMVVKEALNNALKHARPTAIDLRFHIMADRYSLSVADNGSGMRQGPSDGGNGLANMRERIRDQKGRLTIRPAERGTGTVIEASGTLASA